ncbi:MAG: FAD-binding protein [Thermoanaerobaculales bacterium]|nr:FAD-binding protein [Thermoanaerobaculales bacterium]
MEIHERVDLRAWTTLGVGGIAALVARCHSENGVREVIDLAASHGLGWVVLGGGSRLVAPDRGFRVPVVSLTGELARWKAESDGIVAGAGANLAQVCRAAGRAGLSGIEDLDGRHHSIGGFVHGAAHQVLDAGVALDWVELQGPGAPVIRWTRSPSQTVPEASEMHRRVVSRIRFALKGPGAGEIRTTGAFGGLSRPLRRMGPVFLDADDATAADLLDEVGYAGTALGGVRFGGARGNELLAGRSATASDVLELCRRARDRVASATGIELVPALVFLDEDGRAVSL